MEAHLPRRYRILRQLGSGGQGQVWLVSDRQRGDALVALKALPAAGGLGADLESLSAEFLTLARLAHPSIARVRDFGRLEGGSGAYFTSDYVRGADLLTWAADLPVEDRWTQLLDIAAQALAVLQYLSLRGISHGDVKPANLLVEQDSRASGARERRPRLKLIDFGTARIRKQLDAGRALFGTPAYLPDPEHAPSTDGPGIDLHGLGVTLYHAATGRLPFSLGDPGALKRWWKSGAVARASDLEPGIPLALGELIEGLIQGPSSTPFRSAREAIEALRNRVALPPLPQPANAGEAWFPEREQLVERVCAGALDPGRARRIQVISAAPGSGKTRALELLEALFQSRGLATVYFQAPADPLAFERLKEMARGAGAATPSTGPGRAADVLRALRLCFRQGIAFLVDDHATGSIRAAEHSRHPGAAFLCGLAALLAEDSSVAAGARLVLASSSPEAAAASIGQPVESLEAYPLEPLSRDSVAAAIREHFAVEDAPPELIALVLGESGGAPRRVNEALARLSEHGVASDFLGQLTIPRPLPARLVDRDANRSNPARGLDRHEKLALGFLLVAKVPMSAASAHAAYPVLSGEGWIDSLERLRWHGLVLREDGSAGPTYRAFPATSSGTWARELLGAEELDCRQSLGAYQLARACGSPAPDAGELLAAAENLMTLGASARAARLLRRASRSPRTLEDDDALATLSLALLGASEETWAARASSSGERARWCARMRVAQTLTRLGRPAEAIAILDAEEPESPRWRRIQTLQLRADAHESAGDIARAIDALEDLRKCSARTAVAGRTADVDLTGMEAAARLAALYFHAGKVEEGRACLKEGRRWLESIDRARTTGQRPRLCRILARFASAESSHGEAPRARTFLEEAVRLARESGRDDLLLGPLNELGILCGQEQRWPEALVAFEEIEAITSRNGDRLGALKALYNRAIIYYRTRSLEQAETLFRRARALSESMGRHALLATVWLGLAGVLRERGRILQALRLYRRVLANRSAARPNDAAVAHNNVSEIYFNFGRLWKAAIHANLALRTARRIENRFLIGLALRSRGRARLALGNPEKARRDLSKALELGDRDGDDRAGGIASYYLGLLAAATGDSVEALRQFRRARLQSRRARDPLHRHAATIACLAQLSRTGRTKGPRAILRKLPANAPARSRLETRALAELLGELEPGRESLVDACRDAIRGGNVWEAFWTLQEALRASTWSEKTRPQLLLERDAASLKILKSLPGKRAPRFQSFWHGPSRPASASHPPSRLKIPDGDPEIRREEPGTGKETILGLLEQLRSGVDARSTWFLFESDRPTKPFLGAGDAVQGLEPMLEVRARALRDSRPTMAILESQKYLFLNLSDSSDGRCVAVELADASPSASSQARSRLLQLSLSFQLVFRVFEREEELDRERAQLLESKAEVRRLNALFTRDKQGLETALLTQRLEVLSLKRELGAKQTPGTRGIIAVSPGMRALVERLPRIAAGDIPVLLIGESGVGKDLFARRIHDLSPRRGAPYAAEICNITESLMEAELFGFVAGSFTGAESGRSGILERAKGGTLYLDEISGLPLTLQARLLRVFEDKQVRPIGAEASVPVEFRLIASSCLDLEQLRDPAKLRQDFLYRVQGEVIEIPALRDRREDIPELVASLLEEHARRSGAPAPYVEQQAMERLVEHDWRGNVRELENEIQRLCVGAPREITADLLFRGNRAARKGTAIMGKPRVIPPLKEEKLRVEKELLLEALKFHGGNVSRAARALCITRRYLGILIEKHGIELLEVRSSQQESKGPGAKRKPSRPQPPQGLKK